MELAQNTFQVSRRAISPLGNKARKAIIYIEIVNRRDGKGPTWSEVQHAIGLSKFKSVTLLKSLERKGFVTYTRRRRSLAATRRGVYIALRDGE